VSRPDAIDRKWLKRSGALSSSPPKAKCRWINRELSLHVYTYRPWSASSSTDRCELRTVRQ
jgi:hypothetical protein